MKTHIGKKQDYVYWRLKIVLGHEYAQKAENNTI